MGMCRLDFFRRNNVKHIDIINNTILHKKLKLVISEFKNENLKFDIKKCFIVTSNNENYIHCTHSFNIKIHDRIYYKKLKAIINKHTIKNKFLSFFTKISLFPTIKLGEEYFPITAYQNYNKINFNHIKGEVMIIIFSESPEHYFLKIRDVKITIHNIILTNLLTKSLILSKEELPYSLDYKSKEILFYNKIYNITKYPHMLIINKNTEVIFNCHILSVDQTKVQNVILNNIEYYSEDSSCISMLPKEMLDKPIEKIYSIHDDNDKINLETYYQNDPIKLKFSVI
jgi:hypothetical protein